MCFRDVLIFYSMEEHVFLKQHSTKDDIAQAIKVDVQTLYLERIYFTSFASFKKPWDFPGGSVVKTVLPLQGVLIRIPVRKVRLHMSHGVAKA